MFHKSDADFIVRKVSLLFYFGEFEMGYDFSKRFDTDSGNASSGDSKLRDGGTYIMVAESAEEKVTKKGDGKYISIKFVVADGACDGKTIWSVFNIENPSARAANIGLEALDRFAKSLGYADGKVEDLKLLCYIPFLATLKMRRDAQDEIRFEVSKFTALEEPERVRVVSKWTTAGVGDASTEMPF